MDDKQSVTKCLARCSSLGFMWAGLEYHTECYCSKNEPPTTTAKLDDSKCNIPCATKELGDNRPCGGNGVLSIYHNPNVQPPADEGRPLVCLVMMVRNESHTIMETLKTVHDMVDCWYILDTGSTDGTQKIINDYMGDKPGKLFEEPFIDYGATRNRILVLAKEYGNPLFTLMLSADERVVDAHAIRDFLIDMKYARGTMHNAYPVIMNNIIKFDSIRLARVDGMWRYRARVHEYLAPFTGPYVALYRSAKDLEVLFSATDGPRRFQSQYFIKKILEEDLEKDPNDTRSIYYLARTNSGVDNHTAAYYYYELLEKRSKWDEEVYHGMTLKAIESKYIPDFDWRERQNLFLAAFLYKPNSMDAIHALAQDHYDAKRFQLSYIYALRAVQIKTPPPGLTVVENVLLRPTQYLYDYEGHRLLAFAAREIGEWQQCVESFTHVLTVQAGDSIARDRLQLCEQKMREQGKTLDKKCPVPPAPTEQSLAHETEAPAAIDTIYTHLPNISWTSSNIIVDVIFVIGFIAFAYFKLKFKKYKK